MNIDDLAIKLCAVRDLLDDKLRGWAWEILHVGLFDDVGAVVTGRLVDADGTARCAAATAQTVEEASIRALTVAACLHGATWQPAGEEQEAEAPAEERPARPAAPPVPGGAGITQRQANAIFAISRSLGWPREQVLVHVHDEYGVDEIEHLTKGQASDMIERLQRIAAGSA